MTTNPHVKAGTAYGCNFASSGCNAPQSECMNLCLHRVDGSQIKDNRAVLVAGDIESRKYADSPLPYTDIEPMRSFGEWRPLFTGVLVLCIAGLFAWWLA